MARALYKPRAKNLWLLVRRLLCRKTHRPTAAAVDQGDGEKSSLLGRSSSLEELFVSDGAAAVCRCGSQYCAKKHGQHALLPELQRPVLVARSEATAASSADSDGGGAAVQYRRFMFGGFRRRLLMRRPWRPMLVAIPE